jgi:hypothetical protein
MNPPSLSHRRDFLQTVSFSALGGALFPLARGSVASAAEVVVKKEAAVALPALNRFPRMMQDWLVTEVRAAEARGNEKREALKTKADAEAYVKSVQERIRECFGPMPEKTPLNAKVTKKLEREGYRIENVIFESRPGYLVTGNLYLPKAAKPVPGVIGVCGHSLNGKAAEAYQSFAQGKAWPASSSTRQGRGSASSI